MAYVQQKRDGEVLLYSNRSLSANRKGAVWIMTLLFVGLFCLGLLNLYSSTLGQNYFNAQIKNSIVGLVAFVTIGWIIPIRFFNQYSYYGYAGMVILLLVVLVSGHIAGGSQRWLTLGPLGGQPSEFAKIIVAITVARFFFINRNTGTYRLRELWVLFLLVGAIFALIFHQPDLGTAGICLIVACAQLAFLRIEGKSIGLLLLGGVLAGVAGWNLLLHDYQKLRVLNLLNPGLDPYGSGYNSLQSLVAIGSGGAFGKGFLQGTQTQLQFLPARHTDFVFSVFAEEQGFWACLFVFLLFATISYIGLEVARRAKNVFNALLAIGCSALLFIQFAINIAMVLGTFPVVGLPLPFFSYGGSSLLCTCIAVGLLISIERDSLEKPKNSVIKGLHH